MRRDCVTSTSSTGLQRRRRHAAWLARAKDLALAPLRLHRYREVHSRMVRDALCAVDCRRQRLPDRLNDGPPAGDE